MSKQGSSFSLHIKKNEVSSYIHHFTQQEYEAWLRKQENGEASVILSRRVTSCIFITNSIHIEIPSKGDARFEVFGEIEPVKAFCTGMDYVKFLNSEARKEVAK